MTTEDKIAKVFNLTADNWMRHANPWSVGTRYSVLPIIVLWMFFNPVLHHAGEALGNVPQLKEHRADRSPLELSISRPGTAS